MNIKTLLAKSLCLLYREKQIGEEFVSKPLVKDIIVSQKINNQADINGTNSAVSDIKEYIVSVMNRDTIPDYNDLIQSVRLACGNDTILFESIQDSILYDLEQEDIKRMVLSMRFELSKYLKNKTAIDKLDKLNYQLKFNSGTIDDVDKYLITELGTVTDLLSYQGEEIPGIVNEIDFDNLETVEDAFDKIKKEADGSRIIRTPWQAMNRMTRGGIRLGQLTVVAGLGHNNKTGVCLSMFISACMFNNPNEILNDKSKKPLNVLFSFEDDDQIVIGNLYSLLKGNIDNVVVSDDDKKHLDKGEAARYLYQHLKSTGYHVKIIRINPGEWSYIEIQNKISQLESQGYEIHLCLIDYLNLANKENLPNTRADADVQELFRRVKNFACTGKGIAVLTPHQLNGDALAIKNSGNKNMVQQVAGGSYYADCRGLYREPELEIAIDIVKDNGRKYQAFARGKHRGQNDTPEEHKFFILPFAPVGGLRWDINGIDTSLSRYGATRNEHGEEEMPLYDI